MNNPMHLFKREGYWHVKFAGGKRKSLRTADEKTARGIFRELQREYLRGRLLQLDTRRMSLSEFRKSYEEHRPGVSKWTLKKDILSLKLLGEALGDIQMRTLTAAKLDDFKRVCLARKASPITINGYLRHIKGALTYALDNHIIDKKPKIKMLPVNRALLKDRIISPRDLTKILAAAKESDVDLWRYFTFLLWTGARRSEALNLQWKDVSIDKKVCRLRNTKGKQDREVPLTSAVIDALEPVKKDIGPVFLPYHRDTISKMFKRLATACGMGARLHDLRHSAATYMLKSGMPLEVVQGILGHANVLTTMTYVHVLDDIKQAEMRKFKIK